MADDLWDGLTSVKCTENIFITVHSQATLDCNQI